MSARLALGPQWSLDAFNRRDLSEDNTISMGVGLTYQNECIVFSARLARRFTRDRDLEPETSINFVIKLKNLG